MSPHTDPGALLLCPFCGEKPDVRKRMDENLWDHNVVEWTAVECSECGFGFDCPPDAEKSAAELWNTRQATSQGRAGGERQSALDECARIADQAAMRCVREGIPGDAAASFIAQRIRALSPPIKTGGEHETVAQAQQVPKSVVPEGMKPVYLKPWRTIFMIPAGIADAVRDTINAPSPLAWLAEHSNYEITYSGWDEDPVWQVHSVNGGRNDREWKLLTTGKTPEEAIKKAMALSVPSASRGTVAK